MGTGQTKHAALHVRAAGLTDIGRVRLKNEDAFLANVEFGLFVVADGVGGHAAGDVAAHMVVELLPDILRSRRRYSPHPQAGDDPNIRGLLQKSLWELSCLICAEGESKIACKGMGATVVVALLTAHHAHIAHMGDSRAYLLRDGSLRQITCDHSLVNLLVQCGEITPQEADEHPAKNRLTRFVGMPGPLEPEVQTVELLTGDRLLLCTDGLWGMLTQDRLTSLLAERENPDDACRALVAAGNTAGGNDNLTAVVVSLDRNRNNRDDGQQ